MESDRGVITEVFRFAEDDSRYAYEMGFYVPETELDGKVHKLSVTVPGNEVRPALPQWVYRIRQRRGTACRTGVEGPRFQR